MTHNIYLYILVAALVSTLIRVIPLTLIRGKIQNPFLRSFLYLSLIHIFYDCIIRRRICWYQIIIQICMRIYNMKIITKFKDRFSYPIKHQKEKIVIAITLICFLISGFSLPSIRAAYGIEPVEDTITPVSYTHLILIGSRLRISLNCYYIESYQNCNMNTDTKSPAKSFREEYRGRLLNKWSP